MLKKDRRTKKKTGSGPSGTKYKEEVFDKKRKEKEEGH